MKNRRSCQISSLWSSYWGVHLCCEMNSSFSVLASSLSTLESAFTPFPGCWDWGRWTLLEAVLWKPLGTKYWNTLWAVISESAQWLFTALGSTPFPSSQHCESQGKSLRISVPMTSKDVTSASHHHSTVWELFCVGRGQCFLWSICKCCRINLAPQFLLVYL